MNLDNASLHEKCLADGEADYSDLENIGVNSNDGINVIEGKIGFADATKAFSNQDDEKDTDN